MEARQPRGLAALQRDVRRTFARAPMVMVVVPLLIWLPFDLLADLVVPSMAETMGEARAYQKINQLFEFMVGTYVLGMILAVVRRVAANEEAGVRACMGEALRNYGAMISVVWSASWRIGLGFVFLFFPGVMLTARYSLALPIAAWRESPQRGPEALYESEALVEGHAWRLFRYGAWAYTAWTCTLLLPTLGVIYSSIYPEALGLEQGWEPSSLLTTLIALPLHLAAVGVITGCALAYRDLVAVRNGECIDSAPVGDQAFNPMIESRPDTQTGTRALLVVSLTGLMGLAWAIHLSYLLAQSGGF